jgi:ribosomal protein S18 acetylase RimI-like enzyme
MLFATKTLAERIERAERDLMQAANRTVARARPASRAFAHPISGGVATYSGPESPLNKVSGLGFRGPVDEAELERIEELFADRNAPVQVELSSLAEPSVGETLTRRGYTLVGFENVSGRLLSGEPPTPSAESSGLTIKVSGHQDFATWLDTAVTGFSTPDEDGIPSHESFPREVLERVVTDMAGADGFVRYLARRNGAPAGAASIRLGEDIAQLSGAATLPEHRRRGVQTALLARRLADAATSGCQVAVVTTQPGSASQRNVHRHGFALLYTRAVLIRETGASR